MGATLACARRRSSRSCTLHGADSYLRGGAGPVRPDRGPDPDGEDQRVLRLERRDVVIIYYRGLMRPAVRGTAEALPRFSPNLALCAVPRFCAPWGRTVRTLWNEASCVGRTALRISVRRVCSQCVCRVGKARE